MSENTSAGEGRQPNGEGSSGGQENLTEVMQKLKALEATNARLLEESQKTKTKYQEALNRYESVEKERLEKEGNFQVLLEKEKEKNNDILSQMTDLKMKVVHSNIRSTFSKYTSEVHDMEDLLNQPKFSHILKDAIDDTSLSINEDKAKEYLTEVLKAKPHLKKSSHIPTTIDTKPNFQSGDGKSKSVDEMTTQELEALIKSKFNQ
jgi:uncharacterized protein YdiU (UPF0061 family)